MTSSPQAKKLIEASGAKRRWPRPATLAAAGLLGAGLIAAGLTQGMPNASAEPAMKGYDSAATLGGGAPLGFANLVERVRVAVVSVHVKNGVKNNGSTPKDLFKGLPDLPEDHPLNEFFKKFRKGQGGAPEQRKPTQAQGSGFIISDDGYVVTNHHVVGEATEISITMDDGKKFDAELIGSDPRTDIALLKIKAKREFNYVEFSKKEARVGDWVLAVGNPFGLGGSVTAGIVSARGRDIGQSPYDYLQIDAAVNKGNSGGPAFNLSGQVVGVNTAIWSPSGGNVGIAFAVPADLTRSVITQLKRDGSVSRGWLGVTIQNVNEDIAASIGLDEPSGALVTKITRGGPAARSDIKVGDAIVQVNEDKIEDSRDLARTIASLSPKAETKILVFRDGDKKSLTVKLGRFPGMKKLAKLEQGKPVGEEMEDLGLSLAPAPSKPGSDEEGVVITDVEPNSKAADKGLKTGDIILEVGGAVVSEPDDVLEGVRSAKKKGRKAVLLRVRSGSQQRFIALPLKKKKS